MFKFISFFIVIFIVITTTELKASDDIFYSPIVDILVKPGNNRTIRSANFMLPIKQTKDKLLFSDIRFVSTSAEEFEGNFGLAYRKINNINGKDIIFGSYGFLDRRKSQFNNYFTQINMGGEALSSKWSFRTNFYQPLTNDKIIEDKPDTAALTSDGYVLVNNGQTLEVALKGFDIEVGRKIDFIKDTWLNVGFYRFGFANDEIDLEGFRIRSYTDITDWLRLGGEYSHDNVRGSNRFIELKLRIPLQKFPNKKSTKKPNNIYKYMMEPIVRDVDIVTKRVKAKKRFERDDDGKRKKYYFVDNTAPAGGNGTPSKPFNNLAEAEAIAPKNSTIFVRKGDGTTTNMDKGITLAKKNMRFIGSGIDLRTRKGVLIESKTTAPHITNIAGDGVVISANKAEVAGFTVENTNADGIFILNASNANIHDNTITGAGENGIHAAFTDSRYFKITIKDNITNSNTIVGTHVRTFNGAELKAKISNITANNNTNSGIRFEAAQNSILEVKLKNSTTNSNGGNAGLMTAIANNADFDITIKNHTANNNILDGVQIFAGGNGAHDITIKNSSMTNNGTKGLMVDIQDSSKATVTISDITVNANSTDGFQMISRGSADIGADIINFTSTASGQQGFEVVANGINSKMVADLDNITVNTATSGGMFLISRQGSNADITLKNSIIDNNTGPGLFVNAINTSSIDVKIENTDITNSSTYSLQLDTDSSGNFNPDFGGGSLNSVGNNRIFGGGNFDIWSDLDGKTISAKSNWWGVATGLNPANVNHTTGGNIDSSNFLNTDPRP